MIQDQDILVSRLRRDIENRDVQIELLKTQLETKYATIDHLFKLTRLEGRIFLSIWNRRFSSNDDLLSAMYFDTTEPECNEIGVYLWRIRRKIKRFDIKIINMHGQGYHFDDSSRIIIKSMIDEQNKH